MDATFDAASSRPRSDYSLIVMIAGWAAVLLSLMSSAIWTPTYVAINGASPAAMGIIASLQTGIAALTSHFIVPRVSALQPRIVIIVGLTIIAATELTLALISSPIALFAVLKAVDGVGGGLALASIGIMASKTLQPTRTFGILQLSQSVASTILFALSALTIPRFGLAGIFGLVCMASLTALAFASLQPRTHVVMGRSPDLQPPIAGRFPYLGCLALVLMLAVNVGTINSMGAFGARVGMDAAAVSITLSAVTIAMIVSSIVAAGLASIVPNAIVLAVGAVIASVSLLTLGSAGSPIVMQLAAFSTVFGITLAFPAAMAGVAQSDETGRAAAAAQAAGMVGLVLGPVSAGLITSRLSLSGLSIIFSVVVFAAIGLASAIAATRMRRLRIGAR